jgi:hypothetical protein
MRFRDGEINPEATVPRSKHLSENILTFFNAKSQRCKDAKKDSPLIKGVRGLSATLRLCVLALKNKRNFLKVA